MAMNPSLGGFNNSHIVGEHRFDVRRMTDLNSLYELFQRESFTTYKGMLSLFNQRKLMNTPLLNLTELSNSVLTVNGAEGKFRYSVPFDLGLPYIVENLASDIEKPGIDGQRFKIKISEEAFTNTDVITYDYMDGISLYITETEYYQEGDGWVYEVMIPRTQDSRSTWFPQKYLQPGTEYMKISNVNGEYDTQKSSISLRQGIMDLEMGLGSERSVYHWITQYADQLSIDSQDPRYSWMNQYGDMNSPNSTMWFMKKDPMTGTPIPESFRWFRKIEALLWAEIKMMEERDLTWSKGGIVQGSGRTEVRVNTGLYPQMRNGNRIGYSKLKLSIIENALSDLFYNSGIPVDQRRTNIQCGTAAFLEIQRLLAEDFRTNNEFFTTTKDLGIIQGDRMHLNYGHAFTGKVFPVAGQVTFEINPALDNKNSRASDDSVGGYSHSSHTLMIMDVTDASQTNIASGKAVTNVTPEQGFNTGSNIVLIKPKGYEQTYWGYEQGTTSPFGSGSMKGMISSSARAGYGMWIKNQSSIWLKDATKTILIEKNRQLV